MTETSPITAYFSPGIPGYGHRLFIPSAMSAFEDGSEPIEQREDRFEQLAAANDTLKDLSCWKGSDKRWGIDGVEYWGYEFDKKRWMDEDPILSIKTQVEAAGMTIVDFATERDGRKASGRAEMKIETLF